METKLFAQMALICSVLLSCVDATEMELPSPTVTNVMFSDDYQIGLQWQAVPGADGYVVSYGTTPAYGTKLETVEPHITITGLDATQTYYFSVRTKQGEKISSLPPEPVIVNGGVATSGGVVISGPSGTEKPKPDEPQAFNHSVFLAEKAKWEALCINSYQFTGRTVLDYPHSAFTVTVSVDKKPVVTYVPDPYAVYNPQKAKADEAAALGLIEAGRPFSPLQGSAINELYASIEAETANLKGWTAHIRYNQTYHYPELFTKARVNSEFLDGGYWYEFKITHFEVIE
jgi:hypothetical protein